MIAALKWWPFFYWMIPNSEYCVSSAYLWLIVVDDINALVSISSPRILTAMDSVTAILIFIKKLYVIVICQFFKLVASRIGHT